MTEPRRYGLKVLLPRADYERLRRRAAEQERTLEGHALWLIRQALDELDEAEAMANDRPASHAQGYDILTGSVDLAERLSGSEDTP